MEIFAYYQPSTGMIYGAAEVDAMTGDKSEFIGITWDQYEMLSNPPEGKMGAWVDGQPVLVDIPAPDYEAINTGIRDSLITSALATVAAINTKLNMGRTLTQAEKDKMNKVLDYVDALNALDMTPPEISWPAL